MIITGLGAKEITPAQPNVEIKLCSSFTVSNYSTSVLNVIISGISFPVPPVDNTSGLPGIFDMPGDGTLSDVSIKVEFESIKTGKAIIAYRAKTC